MLKPLEEALGDEANKLLERLHGCRGELIVASNAVATVVREIALFMMVEGQFSTRLPEAMARQEGAMMTLVDVALEAEAALRQEDVSTYHDTFEDEH